MSDGSIIVIFLLAFIIIVIFSLWLKGDAERQRIADKKHDRELERIRKQAAEHKRNILSIPNDENPEIQTVNPTVENEQEQFNFWWPTNDVSGRTMLVSLIVIGIILGVGGEKYEQGSGLFVSVVIGVVSWYFIINIGRYILHRSKQYVAAKPIRDEKQREVDELEALRRRAEIKRLKKELGEDE